MKPKFTYNCNPVNSSTLAYDLALVYAQEKFRRALSEYEDVFENTPASPEIEEKEFLMSSFLAAFEYYCGVEPGDFERRLDESFTD